MWVCFITLGKKGLVQQSLMILLFQIILVHLLNIKATCKLVYVRGIGTNI